MNWTFWLESLVRSSVLLILSAVILGIVQRTNAGFRHRFWVCVLGLLCLLPVSVAIVPEVTLPFGRTLVPGKERVTVVTMSSHTTGTTVRQGPHWLSLIWMAGALISLIPLASGVVKIGGIARGARHWRDEVWLSDELNVPITCGFWRSKILLPSAAEEWPASHLEAVLEHERAHIRRGDVATQVAAHLVASLWWFQPLVWLVRRRLRMESELAADAEVIGHGVRRSDYADALLSIAKAAGRGSTSAVAAVAMVQSSNLEDRIRAVLEVSDASLGIARRCVVGLILASTAVAASGLRLKMGNGSDETGGSSMKRTILSALLTSAGISAATLSGTVHDVNGEAIANARVVLSNPDAATTQETTTGSDGKFSFSGDGAGQYVLRIEKPGFTSIFRAFDVKAESNVQRELTMPTEGSPGVADVVTGELDQGKNIHVGGKVAQNNLVRKVQPAYPAAAKSERVQGSVELEVQISKDGVPVELRVVSSPSDDLSDSAVQAVRQWRYRPTLLNGNPVEITTTVMVNYTLSQ